MFLCGLGNNFRVWRVRQVRATMVTRITVIMMAHMTMSTIVPADVPSSGTGVVNTEKQKKKVLR